LRFCIKDTGIGIPKEKLNIVFQRFTQADDSINRRYGGSGLGLTLTQKLVRLMDGSIQVSSEERKGSYFEIELPMKIPSEDEVQAFLDSQEIAYVKAQLEHIHVLVAEDNVINQRLITAVLRSLRCRITVAKNGKEALTLYKKHSFDLILMDIEMPIMDGFEAVTTIRQLEKNTDMHTVIIALTAHALPGDYERCVEKGMDGYLTKPFQANDLLREIYRFFGDMNKKREKEEAGDEYMWKIVDEKKIIDTFGEDAEAILEVVDTFLSAGPEYVQAIADEIEYGDAVKIYRAVHRLKSTLGFITNENTYNIVLNLELQAKEGDLTDIPFLFEQLNDKLILLYKELDELKKKYS
jgi:CheY-like chemotaxis protein